MLEEQDERLPVAAQLYLDLLIRTMTRTVTGPGHRRILPRSRFRAALYRPLDRAFARAGISLMRRADDEEKQHEGISFVHADADTSMGTRRLQFLQSRLTDIHVDQIAGDMVELGCWRGGGAIFMRGFLRAVQDTSRLVWAADSFRGYPSPGSRGLSSDRIYHGNTAFEVSLEEVQERFRRYGLLDDRVRFLNGYFSETLPTAPIEKVALVHIDVSTYEGTAQGLEHTYPKVSPGGVIFIGDYRHEGARRAVDEYRNAHGIDIPLREVPQKHTLGVWWCKPLSEPARAS